LIQGRQNRDSSKNAYQSQPFGAVTPGWAQLAVGSEKARSAALFVRSYCMVCEPDCIVWSLAASLVAVNKNKNIGTNGLPCGGVGLSGILVGS
jgi:hypothetical protein